MQIIRPIEEKDYQAVLDIYKPFITDTAVTFEISVPSPEAWNNRIIEISQTYPWLVCEINGQVAGYAYACKHRDREAYLWNAEVSLYVGKDWHRKGIGTLLYRRLFDILKQQGITNLLAGITIPNPESEAFHQNIGFKKIGNYQKIGCKFNRWYDVGWWELFIAAPDYTPEKPFTPFKSLSDRF